MKHVEDEHSSHDHAAQAMSEFMHEHSQGFKEIESFMHILNDWLEETTHALVSGTESTQSGGAIEARGAKLPPAEPKSKAPVKTEAPNIRDAAEDKDLATDLEHLHKLEMSKVKPQ